MNIAAVNTAVFKLALVVKMVMKTSPAGVQPRQDPGGTLGTNSVSERERRQVRPALIGSSLRGRERKTEREKRMTRWGCLQGLAESGNALFFTVTFIP